MFAFAKRLLLLELGDAVSSILDVRVSHSTVATFVTQIQFMSSETFKGL